MFRRRDFIKAGVAAGAGIALAGRWRFARGAAPVVLLDPLTQPQFINPLPNPLDPSFIFQPSSGTHYEVGMYEFAQPLGLVDPVSGAPLSTTVWGYGTGAGFPNSTYPGRTFEVQKDQQVTVKWRTSLAGPHLLPVDTTLHWAGHDMNGGDFIATHGVPVVPHVHGGHTESDSDGLPEYWWTSDGTKGPRYVKDNYVYDNDQVAGTIWYHDHALGITRLNVYAGLAGFYIIRDSQDTGKASNPLGLPAFPYEIPIVIQDRIFTADGQLFYITDPALAGVNMPGFEPWPGGPSAQPEFFGNIILVNGQAWPFVNVEPRKYRLRLLNGSDSRFYSLWINSGMADTRTPDGNGPMIQVIGTDDALLPAPVPVDSLTIGPGERYDVVVDFTDWNGETLIMRNNARSPFPKGATPNPRTEGRIMAFRVALPLDTSVPDRPLALSGTPITPLQADAPARRLILFEGTDQFGRLQPMLGTVDDGTQLWNAGVYPISEKPKLGKTEIWEVFNATADAHPIHLHLVAFQLLNRQRYTATITPKIMTAHDGSESVGGTLSGIRLRGRARGPGAYEAGWKDTAIMYPGEVTRVIAKFDRPGRYVWHCHILSHEDHEMMRPYEVVS